MSIIESSSIWKHLHSGIFLLIVIITGLALSLVGCSEFSLGLSANEHRQIESTQITPTGPIEQLNGTQNSNLSSTKEAPSTPTAIPTSRPLFTQVPMPVLFNPLLNHFREQAADWGADFIQINNNNTGIWQFTENSFVHPIAIDIHHHMAYLIDKGRVLAVDLENPSPPEILLEPGDFIEGILVLEPLDLGVTSTALVVLDRAGDVYKFDFNNQNWLIDRYNRPVEESSGHYFVAVDGIRSGEEASAERIEGTALLETNYKFAMVYGQDSSSLWNLNDERGVDLSAIGDDVFVLQRSLHEPSAAIRKYTGTMLIESFNPKITIDQPRQVVATGSAVYILDQSGKRLITLDPQNGSLLRLYQLPQEDPPSTFTITPDGQLLFASRDRIYFYNNPDITMAVQGNTENVGSQPHDLKFLASLSDFTVPIGGSNITFRDFQLPGAPRHYRLGVHHGIDFYWQPGTKVLAAGAGTVIRADNDYVAPNAWQLGTWWSESQEKGYTSQETLNNYLGRQVWIEHANGAISKYAHLSKIAPGIESGINVEIGQEIGEVGNSGSPSSLESESADAHLHFEIWFGEHYLGQFLRPVEVREWVEQIFKN